MELRAYARDMRRDASPGVVDTRFGLARSGCRGRRFPRHAHTPSCLCSDGGVSCSRRVSGRSAIHATSHQFAMQYSALVICSPLYSCRAGARTCTTMSSRLPFLEKSWNVPRCRGKSTSRRNRKSGVSGLNNGSFWEGLALKVGHF